MNPRDPHTWQQIQDHPEARRRLGGKTFDPAWYDGDAALDLARLRDVAIEFQQVHPNSRVELYVLDDFTFYMTITVREIGTADIYPTLDSKKWQPCFYVELPDDEREHYPKTVEQALALLQTAFAVSTPSV
jgi:hypothetical protein